MRTRRMTNYKFGDVVLSVSVVRFRTRTAKQLKKRFA